MLDSQLFALGGSPDDVRCQTLMVMQGPGADAIIYSSDRPPKDPVRVPVPFPVPVPVPDAKPVPVWWCGPAAPVCAVVR